jgi:hypothetical protein
MENYYEMYGIEWVYCIYYCRMCSVSVTQTVSKIGGAIYTFLYRSNSKIFSLHCLL